MLGSWVMFLNSWPKMISQMRGCTNVKSVHIGMRKVIFMYLLNRCHVSASMMIPLTDLYSRAYFLSCQPPLAFQAWVSSSDQGEAGVSVCSGVAAPTSSAGDVGAVCFAAPPALVCCSHHCIISSADHWPQPPCASAAKISAGADASDTFLAASFIACAACTQG